MWHVSVCQCNACGVILIIKVTIHAYVSDNRSFTYFLVLSAIYVLQEHGSTLSYKIT